MSLNRSEITVLLDRWTEGESDALTELMPRIVADLRNIARKQLSLETPGHTLQPTALVNELYLKLLGKRTVSWQNRAQFFAFVAHMMRRILVDHARSRRSAKRGSGIVRLSLDESIRMPKKDRDPDLLALDDALKRLEAVDPRQSRLVELRYFTGLSVKEIAEVEGISTTSVKRYWRSAKMWLYRELRRDDAPS